jgi:molecular chaperone GrpE
MMVKKKRQEEDKDNHDNNKIISENKEHTNDSVNTSEVISTSAVTEDVTSNNKESDKVVAEELSPGEKLAEVQDKYIRLAAEFDNYRRRTLREKMDLSKYAGETMLLKIIPLMDDFERALKNMETSTDFISWKNGIELIYSKFSEFLKQNGVKEIESINNTFNVNLHEAVAKVPVQEEVKKGKILEVVLKGYYIQDKVLRFSKVVVGE